MWLYNFCLLLYAAVIALVAPWHRKARLWRQGRRRLIERMSQTISPDERIVWIHVASLGEFEQGRPLIEALKSQYDGYKILVTFFSPSGYEIRKNYPQADYIFYLPLDTPRNARRFLRVAHPEIAIFVKYEFWLNLLAGLRKRRIKTYIVSAIFRRNSIFFRQWGGLWRQALETFDTLFVQNDESKALLSELGFDNVVVAGDTRFDRVAQIAASAKRNQTVERFAGEGRLFVAGSTWQPDEELILRLMSENPEVKFLIAPHEFNQCRIETLLDQAGGRAVRYTECTPQTDFAGKQLLVLDTFGMLSSVYRYASWAYIGGGFGVGIHNTLEAATFGMPIAFGPNYLRFKEARDLVTLGAARSVASYEELAAWFAPLRDDEQMLRQVSRMAEDYTRSHQGATNLILRTVFGS